MESMTVSEARAALPELLHRVEDGAEVTITRHGRPVAVVIRPDLLRGRRLDGLAAETQRVRDLLADPGAATGLAADRADELVRDLRADRDAR